MGAHDRCGAREWRRRGDSRRPAPDGSTFCSSSRACFSSLLATRRGHSAPAVSLAGGGAHPRGRPRPPRGRRPKPARCSPRTRGSGLDSGPAGGDGGLVQGTMGMADPGPRPRSETRAVRDPEAPALSSRGAGTVRSQDLPQPGGVIEALVSIRGSPQSPLLVAPSSRLLETDGKLSSRPRSSRAPRPRAPGRGTLRCRPHSRRRTRGITGPRPPRSPSARPPRGMERSGLAHVLAVSGLHVGLIAGMAWLLLALFEASPTTTRIVILLVLPTYALLAGGSPSAVRAALMGIIYLGARLLGRAVLPMAAVLLTAFLLLLADPTLIAEVSFQLTVLLTAALVRWAPVVSAAIPGPRWIAIAIAVPIIAQLAAATAGRPPFRDPGSGRRCGQHPGPVAARPGGSGLGGRNRRGAVVVHRRGLAARTRRSRKRTPVAGRCTGTGLHAHPTRYPRAGAGVRSLHGCGGAPARPQGQDRSSGVHRLHRCRRRLVVVHSSDHRRNESNSSPSPTDWRFESAITTSTS